MDVYVYQVESVVSIQKIMNDRNIKLDSPSSLRDESLLTGMETYSQDVFTLPITTTQYYDEEYQWTNVLCNHTSDVIFNRLHNVKSHKRPKLNPRSQFIMSWSNKISQSCTSSNRREGEEEYKTVRC